MATAEKWLLPKLAAVPSTRQRLFAWYLTAILIDLVVLGLFVEYSTYVVVDSFTVSLLVAVLLQILFKLAIAAARRVAAFFDASQGRFAKFMRLFCAWLVLLASRFAILEAVDVAFGHRVDFGGPLRGLVALLVVLITMLVAEETVVRVYNRLA